jgi:hypothetical protein
MATTTIRKLRIQATKLGIPGARVMSADKLRAAIDRAQNGPAKVTKRAPAAVKRGPGRPRKDEATPKRGPGRPRKVVDETPTPKRGPGRPRKETPAPKPATRRRAIPEPKDDGEAGRNQIGRVNYSNTDGWNPREGSLTHTIYLSLRKHKGDRDKVFAELWQDWKELVGKKRDGSRRNQADADNYLAFAIARTDWDFAVKTGQHEVSVNRSNSAGNGPPAKRAPARKSVVDTPKRRGRPPKAATASKTKPEAAPKRRGRPPGSKNKPKAAPAPTARRRGRPAGSTKRR